MRQSAKQRLGFEEMLEAIRNRPDNRFALTDTLSNLANAIADCIEDEDTPPDVYNDLLELTETWRKRYEKVSYPAQEARRIRETMPALLKKGRSYGFGG